MPDNPFQSGYKAACWELKPDAVAILFIRRRDIKVIDTSEPHYRIMKKVSIYPWCEQAG